MLNLPTLITLTRFPIVLLLIFLHVFEGYSVYLFPLFLLGSLTDWLDGYLARTMHQHTMFGAFLDQCADKLLVSSALVILAILNQNRWITLPTLLIINRELLMSGLRHLAADLEMSHIIEVNSWGKIKTALQFIALCCLFAFPDWLPQNGVFAAGLIILNIAAFLAWVSLIKYSLILWSHRFDEKQHKK
jgi:CDP-diacylglycerol--glycerol-3-phosphate 3-phosphatidyltransferase